MHRCLSGPRHALPVYVLAQARGVGWQGANLARHHCVHLILPKWGITPDALEFAGDATSPTVLLVSSWKILAVTLPEVSTLPTSATTRRASSTQRLRLMNCSEQISVAQRRTAALLLHARCRDVAPKDLPSARFATLEPQKLFMRMSPGNGCFKKAPHRTRGKVRRWSVGHQRRTRPPVQMARPGPSPITVPSFGAGRGGGTDGTRKPTTRLHVSRAIPASTCEFFTQIDFLPT